MNRRAEKHTRGGVVVLQVGREHRVNDHRSRAQGRDAGNRYDRVALMIFVRRQHRRDCKGGRGAANGNCACGQDRLVALQTEGPSDEPAGENGGGDTCDDQAHNGPAEIHHLGRRNA